MRQKERTKAGPNIGLVAGFLHDVLANLGVDESTMNVRISPKTFSAIESTGKWLSIVSISFYFGMLSVYNEPTPLEKAIHRVELRAQLFAEERKLEKEVGKKDAVARSRSNVGTSAKD